MWSGEKPITDQKLEWGFSSAGRAPALHAGGQEFESPILHHLKQLEQLKSEPKGSFLMLSIHLSFEEIMADVLCFVSGILT